MVGMLNLEHSLYPTPVCFFKQMTRLCTEELRMTLMRTHCGMILITYRSEKIRGAIAQKYKPLITQHIVYNRQPKSQIQLR